VPFAQTMCLEAFKAEVFLAVMRHSEGICNW